MHFVKDNFKWTKALLAAALCLWVAGCPSDNIYSKIQPTYNLTAHQDRKIYIWVEAPRSAAADPDAAEALGRAIRNYLLTRVKVNPQNIVWEQAGPDAARNVIPSPEAAALQTGAELVLIVRIEDYELLPMHIRNYHSGRMLTRTVLLDAVTGQTLWPAGQQGRLHDIVIELGQGDRAETLSRLTDGSAHCILRNLYPVTKMHYRHSDERVSSQEMYELETF